ncbi:hypothetical protein VTK56DRAFT_6581 [Thermocarpiscus australiensis]
MLLKWERKERWGDFGILLCPSPAEWNQRLLKSCGRRRKATCALGEIRPRLGKEPTRGVSHGFLRQR